MLPGMNDPHACNVEGQELRIPWCWWVPMLQPCGLHRWMPFSTHRHTSSATNWNFRMLCWQFTTRRNWRKTVLCWTLSGPEGGQTIECSAKLGWSVRCSCGYRTCGPYKRMTEPVAYCTLFGWVGGCWRKTSATGLISNCRHNMWISLHIFTFLHAENKVLSYVAITF